MTLKELSLLILKHIVMKTNLTKGILASVICLCMGIGAYGQQGGIKVPKNKYGFGIRAMPTFTNMDVYNSEGDIADRDFVVGYGIAGMFERTFSPYYTLHGEVIYNRLYQKYSDMDIERKIKLDQIYVPLLFSINTNKDMPVNLNISAGPQLGVNVGHKIESESSGDLREKEAVIAVKPADFAVAYGAAVEFSNKRRTLRFDLGFRGAYGLTRFSDNDNEIGADQFYIYDRAHLQTYSVFAGLAFLL